jgi:hypothetical protein
MFVIKQVAQDREAVSIMTRHGYYLSAGPNGAVDAAHDSIGEFQIFRIST